MVKIADHEDVDGNGYSKKFISQPCCLGAFIISHSKRLMNDVVIALDGYKNYNKNYSDTDSKYIHKNHYDIVKGQRLLGKDILQSKNNYWNAGILDGLFLAPKIKYCIVINDNGLLQQKISFTGCDREISQVGFKDFLNMGKGLIVRNISKLNWK